MRHLALAALLASSLTGCCTVAGGMVGHYSATQEAERREAEGDPVPDNYVGDHTMLGALGGAVLDTVLVVMAAHSLESSLSGPSPIGDP
jgi:hypothetical protein